MKWCFAILQRSSIWKRFLVVHVKWHQLDDHQTYPGHYIGHRVPSCLPDNGPPRFVCCAWAVQRTLQYLESVILFFASSDWTTEGVMLLENIALFKADQLLLCSGTQAMLLYSPWIVQALLFPGETTSFTQCNIVFKLAAVMNAVTTAMTAGSAKCLACAAPSGL